MKSSRRAEGGKFNSSQSRVGLQGLDAAGMLKFPRRVGKKVAYHLAIKLNFQMSQLYIHIYFLLYSFDYKLSN